MARLYANAENKERWSWANATVLGVQQVYEPPKAANPQAPKEGS
jgi:hypothetical protein